MKYTDMYTNYLLKKDKLLFDNEFVANCNEKVALEDLAFMQQSFGSLGYQLDKSSCLFLSNQNKETLKQCYNKWYQILAESKGANVQHRVFFPQFPYVQNMLPEEMYLREILHYLTVSESSYGFCNQDLQEPQREAIENEQKIILSIINEDEAQKIFIEIGQNFLDSPIAIPEQQRVFAMDIWKTFSEYFHPTEIPFRENMALFVRTFYLTNGLKITSDMLSFTKTMTDLLRVYSALADFSANLSNQMPLVKLSRSSRRTFLQKIEEISQTSNANEDVLKYEFLWKRVFEILHPGEYANRYPNAFKIAYGLRSGTLEKTFEGKLAEIKDEKKYINFLSSRPTEFARKLDLMLRSFNDKEYVLKKLKQIAPKISVSVLRCLWQYYLNRNEPNPLNTRYMMFSHDGKQFCIEREDCRSVVENSFCTKVIEIVKEALANKFSTIKDNRTLFIDKSMQQYAVPVSERQANNQIKTLTFGTRIKLEADKNAEFIRIFTHWKNIDLSSKINEIRKRNGVTTEINQSDLSSTNVGRVDIDLSLEIVDDIDLNNGTSISWHNLAGGIDVDCYHSGDFTTAPDGASEFIDFDYKKARKLGRYAVACNYVYTGQKMSDIPECFGGIMFLPQKGKDGEVFNPQFVKYKYNLAQTTCRNVSFAIDLETLELIWIDAAPVNVASDCGLNIIASFDYKVLVALERAKQKQVSMCDWLMLHGSHFTIVDERQSANIVASDSPDADISPFDTANFAANFMQ